MRFAHNGLYCSVMIIMSSGNVLGEKVNTWYMEERDKERHQCLTSGSIPNK